MRGNSSHNQSGNANGQSFGGSISLCPSIAPTRAEIIRSNNTVPPGRNVAILQLAVERIEQPAPPGARSLLAARCTGYGVRRLSSRIGQRAGDATL